MVGRITSTLDSGDLVIKTGCIIILNCCEMYMPKRSHYVNYDDMHDIDVLSL